MAVSKRTRFEVLRRDNYTCRYCRSTDNTLTIDHVTPVALGGTDEPSNLVAACRDCNAGKSSTSPDADLVADTASQNLRWKAAMQQAADERLRENERLEDLLDEFVGIWQPRYFPRGWEGSIASIYAAGLSSADIHQAATIAISARGIDSRFSYFCGICWKRIRELQSRAVEILADEDGD